MEQIERRFQPREDMNLDVTVRYSRQGTTHGRVRNFSSSGMFVTLNGDTNVPHGAVTMRIYREDVMLEVRGLIVHKENDGVGVMVTEPVTVVELYGGTVYEVAPRVALA